MKKRLFLISMYCLCILSVWAIDNQTVLPWGADEPWEMKYVQQQAETYAEPSDDGTGLTWTQLGYDDSQWETLTGPMANGEVSPVDIFKYTWEGENICFNLRRTFTLDNVNEEGYTFASLHDDDIIVYINGQFAVKMDGASDDIITYFLDPSLFQAGENQLAIYFWGGPFTYNFLDYALFEGNNFNLGNHYFYTMGSTTVSIDHIVYSLDMRQGEAVCQGWDWSDGFRPTESPNIRTTITIGEQDYPVTAIGYYAFMDIDQHWDINIPEGIKYLHGYAFWDSNDIGHISIPSSLIGLGYASAIPCNIESISVAEGNPVYDSRDNCNAVIETETNKAVIVCDINNLPSSVTELGAYCMTGFRGYGIEEFTIPNHIVKTGDAFIGIGDYINVLNIPQSLIDISAPMTLPVPNTIVIDPDNPKYYTEGNCIIEKGTKRLIATWENSQIPNYITSFGRNSLYNYSGNVTLSEKKPNEWEYEGEILGELQSLIVPKGSIPHYIYQGWTNSPFRTISDGIHTYYNRGEGDAWFAPHIANVIFPSNLAGEEVTLSVVLNADQPVAAFQFDLYLPDGMLLADDESIVLSTSRSNESQHILEVQEMADGAWRIHCYSNEDYVFDGNEGEVCSIRVKTNSNMANSGAPITFRNITTTYIDGRGNKGQVERDQLISYINFFTSKCPPASDANTLSTNVPTFLSGKNAALDINLTNENQIIMTEFYLQLPEGITIEEDGNGYPIVTINAERENMHALEVIRNSEGQYHFLCYSSKNNAFKDNDGELFNMKLVRAENVAAGTYTATVRNIIMADIERNEITQSDVTFNISIMDVDLGDTNGDGRINGIDIVETVDYIMGRPSNNFIFVATDLNDDGIVNGLDLVELIELIMAQTTSQNAPSRDRHIEEADNTLTLTAQKDGSVVLGVNEEESFIFAQCIVTLDGGMRLNDITSDGKHNVAYKDLGNNSYSVVCYSMKNATYSSNDELLHFSVTGEGSITVDKTMLVTTDKQGIYFTSVGIERTTEIRNIHSSNNANGSIYSISGSKVGSNASIESILDKGIYIINGKKVVK